MKAKETIDKRTKQGKIVIEIVKMMSPNSPCGMLRMRDAIMFFDFSNKLN